MNTDRSRISEEQTPRGKSRRRTAIGGVLRITTGVGLALVTFASLLVIGPIVQMSADGATAGARPGPKSRPSTAGAPIVVAVALGVSGTDGYDAFGPYEVFARSKKFQVYTVAETSMPVPLNGGLSVRPAYTFDDVASGRAKKPDLVVVPAVNDPAGKVESQLRDWITSQADGGSRVLAICAGARVLAATDLLDGRKATSHWSRIASLKASDPEVDWVSGQRYVQDGPITTTAGVTSGIPASLQVMRQLAGDDEAQAVGHALRYPTWFLDESSAIPVQHWDVGDVSAALNLTLPWLRPHVGVVLSDGISEADAIAPFEVNNYSSAAQLVPIATGYSITTQNGVVIETTPVAQLRTKLDRVIAPAASSSKELPSAINAWASQRGISITPKPGGSAGAAFNTSLTDLAAQTNTATAVSVAKMLEYPTRGLRMVSGNDPRVPVLLILTILVSVVVGLTPTIITRQRRARLSRQAKSRPQS
ncbi:DJ-1/PfpI family protein [Leifsonia sp. LS-T14]|uniref:DJ-1/PfpI family protein n=1 Tax=unclassified Leifsonia TaxID=2663824 RepID=UPI0035A69FE8